jgi:putative ATP-dependent endonuclease of OLD family
MIDTAPSAKPPAAAIYALTIERFRGITSLKWKPSRGVNVVLGGGDVGKTTILEAIALLFSPINPTTLSDPDYHDRDIEAGFSIEAVLSLPAGAEMSSQMKPSWPWEWSGEEAAVPALEHNGEVAGEAVYRVRVRGTEDLELAYEIVQPDGSADSFPVALRRAIGLVRLSGDDRNDRDLRLVQGSALDRLLSDKGLRSRMASELAKNYVKNELTTEAQTALKNLDTAFQRESLPAGLDLAITGGQGASIASMIGLTADRYGTQLPLVSWGAGTHRLSALAIAEQNQGDAPITLVDEVERGLEPYRQRTLIEKLQSGPSQVFLTTHSPAAISAAATSSIWYVDHTGQIGALDAIKIAKHRKTDPEAFLSRLAVVAEGSTELGFTTAILERAFGSVLEQHGVHVSDAGGHETMLGIMEALAGGGLRFGGFADDEGKHPTRWAKLHMKLGALLFRWPSLCIEENIIGVVTDDRLEAFITDPAGEKTGMRLRTLADRLGVAEKDFVGLKAKAGAGFKARIVGAALGTVPTAKESEKNEYKAHAARWFKSVDGGRELADKLFSLALWPALKPQLLPFCNAVRMAVGLTEITDLHG